MLNKSQLKDEDKNLINKFKKSVGKMLKAFKGLQFDEFFNNEIHLNKIILTHNQ